MSKTYEISSLSDLVKIPSDLLGPCLRDLEYAVEMHHFLHGAGSESKPFGPLTWTDDNNHSVIVHDQNGETLLELKVANKKERVTP